MSKKQPELPGAESATVPEIEDAAQAYVDVRDKRMRLTEKEVAAKINLIQTVVDHRDKLTPNADGELCYRFDDLIVVMKPGKPNVKVRHETDGDGGGDDD